MMFTLKLYRPSNAVRVNDWWYFDDLRKDIEKEALVNGIPEIIAALLGKDNATKCTATISNKPFEGAIALEYDGDGPAGQGGVYYKYAEKNLRGWLCPVFWDYFTPPNAPAKMWVKVSD